MLTPLAEVRVDEKDEGEEEVVEDEGFAEGLSS